MSTSRDSIVDAQIGDQVRARRQQLQAAKQQEATRQAEVDQATQAYHDEVRRRTARLRLISARLVRTQQVTRRLLPANGDGWTLHRFYEPTRSGGSRLVGYLFLTQWADWYYGWPTELAGYRESQPAPMYEPNGRYPIPRESGHSEAGEVGDRIWGNPQRGCPPLDEHIANAMVTVLAKADLDGFVS